MLPLTEPRRIVCDLLHFARQVPSVPVQRRMRLSTVRQARRRHPDRPSWVSLFTKAFALVAAEMPPLRRTYLSFPRPRLYEHPESVGSIAVERDWNGEPGVFFGQLSAPDRRPIMEVDAYVHRLKTSPLDHVPNFRRVLRVARLPAPLRRLVWWYGLNASGRKRASLFGTYAVTVYSSLGADSLHPLAPLTTVLNYGPIGSDGLVDVRLVYDHRVMDGATVARALTSLEEMLNGPIRSELIEAEAFGPSFPAPLASRPEELTR
jgi:hypothetical protein